MKNKWLNYIIVCPLFFVLGCANTTTNIITVKDKPANYEFVVGTITTKYKADGCDFLIEATVKGREMTYAAINLDESLKHDGKQFKFKFHPIRAPRKGLCKKGVLIYIDAFK